MARYLVISIRWQPRRLPRVRFRVEERDIPAAKLAVRVNAPEDQDRELDRREALMDEQHRTDQEGRPA